MLQPRQAFQTNPFPHTIDRNLAGESRDFEILRWDRLIEMTAIGFRSFEWRKKKRPDTFLSCVEISVITQPILISSICMTQSPGTKAVKNLKDFLDLF